MERRKLRFALLCVYIMTLLSMTNRALAQGIERESLSGENMADEMRQSGVDQAYNLRLGPVTIRAEADATANFNDNIGISKTDKIADLILTPTAILHARWQVSDLNTLALNIGVGYETYVFNSQYNSLLLSPDSEASFNVFVGPVLLNFHDYFSYQQDPTQIGQLSNTVRLSRWQNDVGVSAKWDLNDIVLDLAYDHANLWVSQSIYNYLTNESDTVAPKITYHVDSSIDTGLNLSFTNVTYQESFQNNYDNVSAGPFVTAKLSANLSVQAQAGGYFTNYSQGGGNGDTQNVASYYANAGVNHRINDSMSESATVGREFLPGLTSNFTERIYANYTFLWQATSTINAGTNIFWENLTDSDATFREDSNRYGVGLNLDDNLTEKATLSFNYQYLLKDADPSYLSYDQNSVIVGIRYQF
jgi:hypothetical protein